jgi:saccharopine dehydrogenase (NAD+, L-lysine-forming)
MRAACLDAGCPYLDVNGEIEDFSAALACDAPARAAGIAILPGVGYGVVFAECLAAQLAPRLPDATWLRLSLATLNGASSRGAKLSTAATILGGGREIYHGALRQRALAFSTWPGLGSELPTLRFAAAPLAELLAVHRSTGIPNIVAGIPLSQAAALLMRIAGPLLGKLLTRQAAGASKTAEPGPPAAVLAALRSRIWAEAGNAAGERVAAMLQTGEGYHAAAAAAVRALESQMREPRVGALTPVQAFGANFALLVPGTRIHQRTERAVVRASEAPGISDVLRRAVRRRKRNGVRWKRDHGVHRLPTQPVDGRSSDRSNGPDWTIRFHAGAGLRSGGRARPGDDCPEHRARVGTEARTLARAGGDDRHRSFGETFGELTIESSLWL